MNSHSDQPLEGTLIPQGQSDNFLDTHNFHQIAKLLSDSIRLRIVLLLGRIGEAHVTALCDYLNMSQPAVSHHLAILRFGGVLEARRDGKHNYYDLTPSFRALCGAVVEMIRTKMIQPQLLGHDGVNFFRGLTMTESDNTSTPQGTGLAASENSFVPSLRAQPSEDSSLIIDHVDSDAGSTPEAVLTPQTVIDVAKTLVRDSYQELLSGFWDFCNSPLGESMKKDFENIERTNGSEVAGKELADFIQKNHPSNIMHDSLKSCLEASDFVQFNQSWVIRDMYKRTEAQLENGLGFTEIFWLFLEEITTDIVAAGKVQKSAS